MSDVPANAAAAPDMEALFDAARPYYTEAIAAGLDRFFDPPRETCPWCGSPDVPVLLRARDTVQGKPGRFTLCECRTCGHVFQNPCLNPDGLAFYYRDFYDGIGRANMEGVFDTRAELYRSRARMLEPFMPGRAQPRAWLDVGAGYGHFCRDARTVWPGTVFDGLDQGQGVRDAAERGWVDTAHHGWFPELAEDLRGRYDVISMYHYLEHVLDIRAELDLTARVMPDGGYLLVELPNPASRLRVLGRWWVQWFQPQHLHMPPLPNLLGALVERGLEPVHVQTAQAHIPVDILCAVGGPFMLAGPHPGTPWRTAPRTRARERRHELVWTKLAPPFLKAAYWADNKLDPIVRRTGDANLYRVLARKTG